MARPVSKCWSANRQDRHDNDRNDCGPCLAADPDSNLFRFRSPVNKIFIDPQLAKKLAAMKDA